jgi:hypothetical protein
MSDPAAAPTHLKDTLEEMRASVAARGARRGLRGAIQEAILGFLEVLLALLADFRAGRLTPVAPSAEAPPPRLVRSTAQSPARAGEGANGTGGAITDPLPSRIGPHFREQEWEPVTGPSPRVEPAGNASLSVGPPLRRAQWGPDQGERDSSGPHSDGR